MNALEDEAEQLEVPSIYFAREVFERDGMLFAVSEFSSPNGSPTFVERVRYRTVGDPPTRWGSTTSGGSRCARRRRCSPTRTR